MVRRNAEGRKIPNPSLTGATSVFSTQIRRKLEFSDISTVIYHNISDFFTARSSIHSMNLSRGTMMRLPRVWWGNPCGGLPRRHKPSRCPAHGTYPPRSASAGVHQRNSIWIFSFSSFLPFAQKDFILCFAAQFLSRLHGHVRPLLLVAGWLVPQGHALLLQLFQPLAVDLDSAGAGLRGGVSRKIRLMWWSNRVTASIAEGGRFSSKWFRRYCAY